VVSPLTGQLSLYHVKHVFAAVFCFGVTSMPSHLITGFEGIFCFVNDYF